MNNCPRCQTPNRPEAKFCIHCGAPLEAAASASLPETVPLSSLPQPSPQVEAASMPSAAPPTPTVTCPHCGAAINAAVKFCTKCGKPLAQVASAPQPPPAVAPAMPVSPAAAPSQSRVTRPVFQGAPPPYSPPPYSPPKPSRQNLFRGMSRGQKLFLLGFAIAVAATFSVLALFLVFRLAMPQPTATPTLEVAPPQGAIPASTPGHTVIPVATSTPMPTMPRPQESVETVRRGEGLYDVCLRHCPEGSFEDDVALKEYAHQVADLNALPWLPMREPKLFAGQELRMPPCP
jgi:hypothetical protein